MTDNDSDAPDWGPVTAPEVDDIERLARAALAALPEAGQTQFTDPFGLIDPAWGTNRSAPAGFTSILFGGDRRLQLTVDQTGGTAARAPGFGSTF